MGDMAHGLLVSRMRSALLGHEHAQHRNGHMKQCGVGNCMPKSKFL
jgi:hypothetical protein